MKILLILISTVVSLVIGEVVLRYFTIFPITESSNKATDLRIGYRLSSSLPEIDSHGFRNEEGAKDASRIFAIGDSHTYGNNVRAQDAWPAVFSRNIGIATYNYGLGGFNLYNYHAIFSDVIDRDIEGIIFALYPTNDLNGEIKYCFKSADYDYWKEQIDILKISAPRSYAECRPESDKKHSSPTRKLSLGNFAVVSAIDQLVVKNIKEYAKKSPIIIRMDRFIKNLRYHLGFSQSGANEDAFFRFSDLPIAEHKNRIRRNTNDMELTFEDSLPTFRQMVAYWYTEAKRRGIKVGVVIIPSREQAVYRYLETEGMLDLAEPEFRELVLLQNDFEQSIKTVLKETGMPYEDAANDVAAEMQNAIAAGRSFYPSTDSHPLEDGYRGYAKAAQRLWSGLTN